MFVIDNEEIEYTSSSSLLGVLMDNKLSSGAHSQQFCKKANCKIGVLLSMKGQRVSDGGRSPNFELCFYAGFACVFTVQLLEEPKLLPQLAIFPKTLGALEPSSMPYLDLSIFLPKALFWTETMAHKNETEVIFSKTASILS